MYKTSERTDFTAPLCACGCRAKVTWNAIRHEWNVYRRGHAMRVKYDGY